MAMPNEPKNPWESPEADVSSTSSSGPSTAPDLAAGLEASAQQPASWRDTAVPSGDETPSIETQSGRASKSLDRMSHVVRDASDRLRASGDHVVSFARAAASHVDRAVRAVPQTRVDDLVGGIRTFARRHPVFVAGGAVGLCVMGAVLLRNSRTAHSHTVANPDLRPM
jgi:hypothetical protein